MDDLNNRHAQVVESVERLELELRNLTRKRDQTSDPQERQLLEQEIQDLEAELKYNQARLD